VGTDGSLSVVLRLLGNQLEPVVRQEAEPQRRVASMSDKERPNGNADTAMWGDLIAAKQVRDSAPGLDNYSANTYLNHDRDWLYRHNSASTTCLITQKPRESNYKTSPHVVPSL
jgi:hypothetical protein